MSAARARLARAVHVVANAHSVPLDSGLVIRFACAHHRLSVSQQRRCTMVFMQVRIGRNDSLRPERVQLSRGQWRSEVSAGWWESVTVTWSPAPAPERHPAPLHRALVTVADVLAPALADLVVEAARRVLERQYRGRRIPPSPRRYLAPVARAIPRSDRTA